jgi:hypothetical protein
MLYVLTNRCFPGLTMICTESLCQQPFARKLINAIEDAHRHSAGERP